MPFEAKPFKNRGWDIWRDASGIQSGEVVKSLIPWWLQNAHAECNYEIVVDGETS